MLLVPQRRSCDINDISEMKEVRRDIVIYKSDSLNEDCKISIINFCIQNGDIGGIQNKFETLYSMNMYYGTISDPFIIDNIGKLTVNRDALIRIINYSYGYKMIDNFKDTVTTTNSYDGMFHSNFCFYGSATGEESIIAPSDPRFYNLDHQIRCTNDDSCYFSDTGDVIGMDTLAKEGYGVGYRLSDFMDPNTTIKVSKIKILDPYSVLKKNSELLDFVNECICAINNFCILLFAKTYRIVIDKQYGYNISELKRSFKIMDRKNERMQLANLWESVKFWYDRLMDSVFNIRINIAYYDYTQYVSILPIFEKENKIETEIQDYKLDEYCIDNLYNKH